jgi:thymidylate synthase
LSLFGEQLRFDLQEGFPLVTTKKVHTKSVLAELLWFLRGETNIKTLDATIWDEWANVHGDLGPIYGAQWVNWNGEHKYDQLTDLINGIKAKPDSRRHIISAWNVADLPDESKSPQENVNEGKMALAPCHCLFQFYVANGKLSCHLYQRSADIALGVPFNIASYAFLTHMVAQQTDLEVGELIISFGDVHMYVDHVDGYNIQRHREIRPLPSLKLNKAASIFDYKLEDFVIEMYEPWPNIKFPIAV